MDSMQAKGCFFVSVIAAVTLSPAGCLGFTVWYYAHDKVLPAIFWLIATAITGYIAHRLWRAILA